MVIWVYNIIIAFFATEDLNGSVGNDFVSIHVKGSSGTALNWVYDKIIMEFSGNNFITGLNNRICDLFVQQTYLAVGNGTGFLDISQTVDNLRVHVQSGNVKVFCRSQGLDTIIYVFRNVLGSDGIGFYTIIILLFYAHVTYLPYNNKL